MVALEVDAIRDRLEVVLKPMQGLLANARGYLGTTLLGDGRVLLVLDLKELLP
jgi:two-component system, chemotaxis family, sensor kinase CheA